MFSAAIAGLGAVVRNIHIPALAHLKDRVQIVAGCDPEAAARDHAHHKLGIPRVFETLEEMLRAVHPDAVSICTPPWLHREQTEMALAAGCHVFCEKPLAENLADADAMIRASDTAGRRVAVNNQFPFMRIHQAAKNMIGKPEFGELLHVHAWHTMRTGAVTEAGWRGQMQRRLGFEFGIHVLDLIRYYFGEEPTRLMAHMPTPMSQRQCDTVNVIALEFADGRGASVMLDRLSRGTERYLDTRLDGSLAAVRTTIGGRMRVEAGLHTRERRPFVDIRFAGGGEARLEDGNRTRLLARDPVNPFAAATALHFRNFLDALKNGTVPHADIRDNRKSLALTLAAYESAESRQWIELGRTAATPRGC